MKLCETDWSATNADGRNPDGRNAAPATWSLRAVTATGPVRYTCCIVFFKYIRTHEIQILYILQKVSGISPVSNKKTLFFENYSPPKPLVHPNPCISSIICPTIIIFDAELLLKPNSRRVQHNCRSRPFSRTTLRPHYL